jgi:fibro-slime domain-containing protein
VFTDWDRTGLLGTCPTSGTGTCTATTGIAGIGDCYVEGEGSHRLRIDTNVTVIQSADSFKQWYNDSSASVTVKRTLELALQSGNTYQFSSSNGRTITDDIHDIFMKTGTVTSLQSGFFPLEDQTRTKICNLWPYWASGLTSDATCVAADGSSVGSQWDPKGSGTPGTAGTGGAVKPVGGKMRNFYFTSEVRYLFRYTGGGTLAFYGDDDVWVFINGKLALDLGAPHMRLQGSVTIDATKFDLQKDKIYEIAVFHADRHPRDSNYQLTLSGFSTNRSVCQATCGDSKVTSGEECDEGDKNQDGLYNGCTKSCKFGPFCGDGDVNGSEECDDGQNTTVTASKDSKACGPGCKFPPKCGDGKIQTGEQCDDGNSNTDAQCGGCSSTCTSNPICGDGKLDEQCGEECDDGANIGGYSYCKEGCVPDARCGDGNVDEEFGETCDLGDGKNGEPNSDGKIECTSTCGVPAVCGDKVVTPPEACDNGADANTGEYGGCTSDCQLAPYCGDGAKNGPEECDYGAANTPPANALYGGCLTTCKLGPRCGDNVTQSPPEQCDTGADSQTCSANCVAKIRIF